MKEYWSLVSLDVALVAAKKFTARANTPKKGMTDCGHTKTGNNWHV